MSINKSTNFSGQPIIKQVLKFIDHWIIYRIADKYNSDRYTKKFTTYEHLKTLIFTVIAGCSSLREVTSIMLAFEGKINHLGLEHFPKRSTLSDANRRRSSEVFADIYFQLYKRYKGFLSYSRIKTPTVKDLLIVGSTTPAPQDIPSCGVFFANAVLISLISRFSIQAPFGRLTRSAVKYEA